MDSHARYLHDPIFKSLVDSIQNLIASRLELNPAEIEEACRLAVIHYEQSLRSKAYRDSLYTSKVMRDNNRTAHRSVEEVIVRDCPRGDPLCQDPKHHRIEKFTPQTNSLHRWDEEVIQQAPTYDYDC